jgi:hypothetical protein
MKQTFIRIVVLLTLLTTTGVTPVLADTNPIPFCLPGRPCLHVDHTGPNSVSPTP